MSQRISIIDCGTGNLHSVATKLARIGVNATIAARPADLSGADKLVLPGVGHFGEAMKNLRALHMVEPLWEAARVRRIPILGICLGMQLMAHRGTEGDAEGLGWVDAEVVRLQVPDTLRYKVPHVGWSRVAIRKNSALMKDVTEDAEFYFVHSHILNARQPELVLCESAYPQPFASAIEDDNLFGVQFHPEKSYRFGEQIFRNFVGL